MPTSPTSSKPSNGVEVEIDVLDKATLKLVVAHPPALAKPAGRRILGAGVGLVKVPTEEEWYAMKKQMEHEMLEGSFFPPELSSVRPRLATCGNRCHGG